MDWWYARDGKQIGPFSEDDFRELIGNGTVKDETLVWHEGLADWKPCSDVPDVPRAQGAPPLPRKTAAESEAPDFVRVAVDTTAPATDTAPCAECGRRFPTDEMIRFEGVNVCAECKPVFFQRIQEGADAPITGGMGETPNAELMAQARSHLDGQWGLAIGTYLAFIGISMAVLIGASVVGSVVPFVGNVAQLLIMPPLEFGLALFFITLVRHQGADIGQIFKGFSYYGATIGVYFFRQLIIGAWSALAMLPGIILMIVAAASKNEQLIALAVVLMVPGFIVSFVVTYMYMWPMYILADNPSMGIFDAIKQSRLMMRGMKWKFFCLNLRFIGWGILCVLTLGLGFIVLAPYMTASFTAFYDDTRGRASLAT